MNEADAGDHAPPEVYGERYYACHCGPIPYDRSQPAWGELFGSIAGELVRTFRPRCVFEAGCALGFLVEAFWDKGVIAYGRDISKYAIANTRPDIRQYCSVGSLVEPIEGRFDLITCIEVLEHMTEEDAGTAIANMTAAADRIVFSSSPTDLTEPTHINVKPPIYWMKAFAAHDFAPLIETTLFSITPYALAFERRNEKPSDDFLAACAEVVRARMKAAEDAAHIHEISEKTAESERIVASLTADRDNLAAEYSRLSGARDQLAAEKEQVLAALAADQDSFAVVRERLVAERDRALNELASTASRSAALQASLYGVIDANTHLQELIEGISKSKSWRAADRAVRIIRRLSSSGHAGPQDLLEQAKGSIRLGFDREFYLKQYPDVAEAGIDPLEHYIRHGRSEGRAPSKIALERAVHRPPASGACAGSGANARESVR
jgi:SAM-dependent methyltransferase